MNRLFHIILEWPKLTIAFILLISAPLGSAYLNKSHWNSVKQFFEDDDPIVEAYEAFQEMYGNEEIAIIVIHSDAIFTNKMLSILQKISEEAKSAPGVQRVFSLTEAKEPVGREDTVSFQYIIPRSELDEDSLRELKERVLHRELTTDTLISKDGKTTVVILELQNISSAEDKRRILNHIEFQTRQIVGDEATLYFSGAPYVEAEINALTQKDDKVFTPILVGLIFIVGIVTLKRLSLTLLSLVNIGVIMVWVVGAFVLEGNRMNIVTVVLPPMILTVGMADAIHVLVHFNTLYSTTSGRTKLEAIFETVSNLWFPCFFTSVTNAVGFLSFLTAPIPPLRTLGLYGALGAMLEFFMSITLLPALIVVLIKKPSEAIPERPPKKSESTKERVVMDRALQGIRQITIQYPWTIVIVFIALMVVAAIGAKRIRYETRFANYLSESNPIKEGVRFIEKNLSGTVPVALLIRAKSEEKDFTHPDSLKLLDRLQDGLKMDFEGKGTSFFSVADYFKEIHRAFNEGERDFYRIPDSRLDVLDYYEFAEADMLARFISDDRMEARISFNVYLGPITHNRQMEKYLDAFLQEHQADFSYQITGASRLVVAMDLNLKECLLNSFTSAFIVIFFLIHLICKNWKLTLITIPPNLCPILITFGIMGFWGIPLDISTVMIASITMSIAVDDTVHFMVWFRRFSLEGMQTKEALLSTYKHIGKEMLTTALILCLAFLALLAGSVLPVRAFGALTCLALFCGILAELFLLPALIMIIRPEVQKAKWRWFAFRPILDMPKKTT